MARSKHTRRNNMINGGKLIIGLVAVVLVFILVFVLASNNGVNNSDPTTSIASITDGSSQNIDTNSTASGTTVSGTSSSVTTNTSGDFNLILVNAKNLLPSSYSIETKVIADGNKTFNPYSLSFDARAVDSLNQLLKDAQKEGLTLYVISAYRAMSKQTSLYDAEVERQKANHPEYSDEEAKAAAGKNVAIPGTSEHQLGLAVDFNSVETSFENTDEFRWLKENAAKYGFVNRYPKDKVSVTGINYEPWHYRYVGVEHAKKMNEKGLCLEEYVKTLNQVKTCTL